MLCVTWSVSCKGYLKSIINRDDGADGLKYTRLVPYEFVAQEVCVGTPVTNILND